MGGLVSVIDELAAEDLGAVDDTVLTADVTELVTARRRLDAEVVRRVGEVESRGLHVCDGFVSVAAWLRVRCRLLFGGAKRLVALSRALRRMPVAEEAFRAGALGVGHVSVLSRAATVHPGLYGDHEDVLVAHAETQDPGSLRKVVDHWLVAADPDPGGHGAPGR